MKKIYITFAVLIISVFILAEEPVQIIMDTTYGEIKMELYPDVAPKTVRNFVRLTKEGYFNNMYFHRVIPEFMIQAGDENTKDNNRLNDGYGSPGYAFSDEINADALKLDTLLVKNSMLKFQFPPDNPNLKLSVKDFLEKSGYKYRDDLPSIPCDYAHIAMANSGPNTNSSQFFIITGKEGAPWLNGKHTVFGKVIEGMEVVHKIENLPRDKKDNPLEDVKAVIKTVKIVEKID